MIEKINAPELQPPGAGLPAGELFFAKMLFLAYRCTRTREQALSHFSGETEKILKIVEPLPVRAGGTAVLIKRVPGIEDSSRFWSPYMVLQHLVIVDSAIIGLIEALLSGNAGKLREVKIADVKPDPKASNDMVGAFGKATSDYNSRLSKLGKLKGSPRHAHPWFGALDAHGWNCLAAVHHTIHRRQLEAIIELREFWGKF
jgi:hypothetical protein